MTQPPVIPPRPSRSPQKQTLAPSPSSGVPTIPPRPSRRNDRSLSPMFSEDAPLVPSEPTGVSNMNSVSLADKSNHSTGTRTPPSEQGGDNERPGARESAPESEYQASAEVQVSLELYEPRPTVLVPEPEAKIQTATYASSAEASVADIGGTEPAINNKDDRSYSPQPEISQSTDTLAAVLSSRQDLRDDNDRARRASDNSSSNKTTSSVADATEENPGHLDVLSSTTGLTCTSYPVDDIPVPSTDMLTTEPADREEAAMNENIEQEQIQVQSPEEHDVAHGSLHEPNTNASLSPSETLPRKKTYRTYRDETDVDADEVSSVLAPQPSDAPRHSYDRRDSDDEEDYKTPHSSDSRQSSEAGSEYKGISAQEDLCTKTQKHMSLEGEESRSLTSDRDAQEGPLIAPAKQLERHSEPFDHRIPCEDAQEDLRNMLRPREATPALGTLRQGASGSQETEVETASETSPAERLGTAGRVSRQESHEEASVHRGPVNQNDMENVIVKGITSQDNTQFPLVAKEREAPVKPVIPPRPIRNVQRAPLTDASGISTISSAEKRLPPTIPGRPKPQLPTRPVNLPSRISSEGVTKVIPAGLENDSVAQLKEKPTIPARPGGSRIAALKAGFLSDLNSRLQVGPQGPKLGEKKKKEEETLKEKVPLNDARKGRARGPARRKPTSEVIAPRQPLLPDVKITATWSVWQINEQGHLVIGDNKDKDKGTELTPPNGPFLPAGVSAVPETVKDVDNKVESLVVRLKEKGEELKALDNVEPNRPDYTKPDNNQTAVSESTEAADIPLLSSKEPSSPIAPLPAAESDFPDPVADPATEHNSNELHAAEVSDLGPEHNSVQSLEDTTERTVTPIDGRDDLGGKMHSCEHDLLTEYDDQNAGEAIQCSP